MSMRFLWLSLCPLAVCATALGAELVTQGGNLSADIYESNLRNDIHVLRGNVRISQGEMSIEAEQATASALQSPNSRWNFERSVHIQTDNADLKSNSATAAFSNGELAQARAQGTPALFEQRRTASDKQVKGRAGVIEYDTAAGIVKLSGQVWFSYGGNEFRGDIVVYNIREERVTVNPTGEQRGRVNITIRPRPKAAGGSQPPAADEGGE